MTHNFSSCQGELAQQTFLVKAVDQDNKNVLVDETMTTQQNGFFEIWLPRNRRIMVNVRQGDLRAEGVIETFPDSKTCVTTFLLQ
ncbi:MAG: CueP family metal-binding protein [Rectinemataceae bacterium]|nr:CueP family metal-binding protein [Rectinemataceae bacterium]